MARDDLEDWATLLRSLFDAHHHHAEPLPGPRGPGVAALLPFFSAGFDDIDREHYLDSIGG